MKDTEDGINEKAWERAMLNVSHDQGSKVSAEYLNKAVKEPTEVSSLEHPSSPVQVKLTAPAHLGTLADQGGASPKPSRLDRLGAKEDARKIRVAKDAAFRKAVIARDCAKGLVDRITGQKMARTMEARPDRLEVHHLEGRRNQATRYDPRNGIAVRLDTHLLLTAHEIKVVAGRTFVASDGIGYWDADYPLTILDFRIAEKKTV
jgi:hypothetical protein